MQPDTSKEAYESLDKEHIREIHRSILNALEIMPAGGTFEQIAHVLNEDPSKIWRRMSELCKDKKVGRDGSKRPLKSGRNAYVWFLGIEDNTKKVYEKGTETAAGHALNLIEKQLSKSVSKKIHLEFLD